MRQFELINADGERWNVTEAKTFLHSVSGLGYEFTKTFRDTATTMIPIMRY